MKEVSAGYRHTVAIKDDDSLWAWGDNQYGQLGNGESGYYDPPINELPVYSAIPVQVGAATDKWKAVSAWFNHTVAIKDDGSLWAWGANQDGQLGDGTTNDSSTPVQVIISGIPGAVNDDWKAVSTGGFHTVAIKENGELWAWGSNNKGQLGDGTTNNASDPIRIGTGWESAFAGSFCTMAIKSNGELYAWGYNFSGQLGDGTTNDSRIPVQVIISGIPGAVNDDWKAVSVGAIHVVAIKKNGELWAWGENYNAQLGDGTTNDSRIPVRIGTDKDWDKVSAKYDHTVAIKKNGGLWAWGYNFSGQLGSNTETATSVPIQIGKDKWIAVSAGGEADGSHTVAIKSNGELYAWGLNNKGQLGDGTTNKKTRPTKVVHSTGE